MSVFKMLTVRVPKELWLFLKKTSMQQETTMNSIVCGVLKDFQKEKKIKKDVDILENE